MDEYILWGEIALERLRELWRRQYPNNWIARIFKCEPLEVFNEAKAQRLPLREASDMLANFAKLRNAKLEIWPPMETQYVKTPKRADTTQRVRAKIKSVRERKARVSAAPKVEKPSTPKPVKPITPKVDPIKAPGKGTERVIKPEPLNTSKRLSVFPPMEPPRYSPKVRVWTDAEDRAAIEAYLAYQTPTKCPSSGEIVVTQAVGIRRPMAEIRDEQRRLSNQRNEWDRKRRVAFNKMHGIGKDTQADV